MIGERWKLSLKSWHFIGQKLLLWELTSTQAHCWLDWIHANCTICCHQAVQIRTRNCLFCQEVMWASFLQPMPQLSGFHDWLTAVSVLLLHCGLCHHWYYWIQWKHFWCFWWSAISLQNWSPWNNHHNNPCFYFVAACCICFPNCICCPFPQFVTSLFAPAFSGSHWSLLCLMGFRWHCVASFQCDEVCNATLETSKINPSSTLEHGTLEKIRTQPHPMPRKIRKQIATMNK